MRVLRSIRRFGAASDGNATLEFMILIPFLTFMMLALGEMGVFMTRHVNLDRSLDLAMRDVRLGEPAVSTPDGLRQRICEEAFLIGECSEALLLELTSFSTSGAFSGGTPTGGVTCKNRNEEIDPVLRFDPASPGEIVIVRVCVVVDPVFPSTSFMTVMPSAIGGGYAVLAESAFINEPN